MAIMHTMPDRGTFLCKCMKKAGNPVASLVHIADAGCRRLPDNQDDTSMILHPEKRRPQ
jgi:hypothetical protein